jgi:hypothetical protein
VALLANLEARSLQALRHDVRQGYVSLASAWDDYGVRFDPQSLEVLEVTEYRSGRPRDR